MLTVVDRELLLSSDSPTAPRSSAIAQMNVAPRRVPGGIDTRVSIVLAPPAATARPRLPINVSSVVQTLSPDKYSPNLNGPEAAAPLFTTVFDMTKDCPGLMFAGPDTADTARSATPPDTTVIRRASQRLLSLSAGLPSVASS